MGLVLITTKKGNEGGLRVNYSGSYGVQTVANSPKMLTGEQYRDVLNGIIDAGGGNANERITGSVTNTDWQSMLSNKLPYKTMIYRFKEAITTPNTTYPWAIWIKQVL
jgi:hypothetical protein